MPYYQRNSYNFPRDAANAWQIIHRVASQNAVVIFSRSTCCMCLTVKRLFCGMGVSAMVYELDHESSGKEVETALRGLHIGGVPVVFVGGELVGSVDKVLASHINGKLVPLLKEAGALWL